MAPMVWKIMRTAAASELISRSVSFVCVSPPSGSSAAGLALRSCVSDEADARQRVQPAARAPQRLTQLFADTLVTVGDRTRDLTVGQQSCYT